MFNPEENRFLMIIPILLNVGFIGIWILREAPEFLQWSVAAGVWAIITIFSNFLTLGYCYHLKDRWRSSPFWWHLIVRSWWAFVLFATILIYGGFVYMTLSIGGIFPIEPQVGDFIKGVFGWGVPILHGCYLVLIFGLMATNYYNRMIDNESENTNTTPNSIWSPGWIVKPFVFFYRSMRPLLLAITFLLLIIGFVLCFYIVVGDVFMLPTYFSIPLTIGLYIPVMIGGMALVRKDQRKAHRQLFWSYAKVFGLLAVINFIPIAHTSLSTNCELDRQFAAVYGKDWQDQIPSDYAARLRPYRYSMFDNLYGYNFSSNVRFNISYTTDFPHYTFGNTTIITHTFYFDAYLPPWLSFGDENIEKLPVVIMMHGEVEDKGPWNANMTSQILAHLGFLVCDMNYGYITFNEHGENFNGYLLSQVVRQLGRFTQFLANNSDYFHADLTRTFFSGRHLGGYYALICGIGYNKTLTGWFAPEMRVRGIIPFYPKSDIGTENTALFQVFKDRANPFLPGSADPLNASFNQEWLDLNPMYLIDNTISPSGSIAPMFFITGTHDYLIPISYSDRFITKMHQNGHTILVGKYLWGSDGFDGAYFSIWGQSILYYMSRFLCLCN
jgi:hypothetical protein